MPQDSFTLTPVDHDPNDYTLLTPVDHDPWLDAPNTLQDTTKLKSGLKSGESTSKQAEDVSEAVPRNIASGTVPVDDTLMPPRMRTMVGAVTHLPQALYDPVRSFGTVMQPIEPTGPLDAQGNPTWSDADEARAIATDNFARSSVGKAARDFVFGGAAASSVAALAGGRPVGFGMAGSPVEESNLFPGGGADDLKGLVPSQNKTFRIPGVGRLETFINPTEDQIQSLSRENPFPAGSDQSGVRVVNDKYGNRFVWRADQAIHTDFYDMARDRGIPLDLYTGDHFPAELRPKAFYSQLESVIDESGNKSASPEQWKATLDNKGVTKEERQYTGVDQFLDQQKGPVSKQDLQQHVKDNGVQVGEVIKGDEPKPVPYSDEPFPAEAPNKTKYSGYTLPGGENYKEMLLTLPESDRPIQKYIYRDPNTGEESRSAGAVRTDNLDYGKPNFKSEHWDEPNVLAHIRFDDRTVNGDRALHIAEVQSDWHQKGRAEGYEQNKTVYVPTNIHSGNRGPEFSTLEEAKEYWRNIPEQLQPNVRITPTQKVGEGVPDAPFKTSWPDLALKRMLHYAAEHGYDRLSWDTGATNAERYDLSKQADAIHYAPERQALRAVKNGDVIHRQIVAPEKLPDVIGKDVAKKLLEQPLKTRSFASGGRSEPVHSLEGQDLKVGGEGMNAFYDRMLPNAVNKLVKKYGTRIEKSSTPVPPPFEGISGEEAMELLGERGNRVYGIPEMPRERARFWRDASDYDRQSIFAEARRIKDKQAPKEGEDVHSVKITPELKNAALTKGFKLFTGSDEGGGALTGFVPRGLSGSGAKLATARSEASAGPAEATGVDRGAVPGGVGRTPSLDQAQREAHAASGGRPALAGLPTEGFTLAGEPYVPGPIGYLHDIAEDYMRQSQLPYHPPTTYAKVDPARAARIAQAYQDMPHAPNDPAVAASYDAMANETLAQYRAIKAAGLQFEFIRPGMDNPYAESPRMAARDVIQNKHLWVYPSDAGLGTERNIGANTIAEMAKEHPLLRQSGEIVDGRPATVNDIFRIVHDVFGHLKDGNGFRAAGEENAWRSHSAMYSDLARPAMTSETRGQNSWVNYGPHGEANRTASDTGTVYADQKTGTLPQWAIEEGRRDPFPAGAEPVDLEHARAPYSNLIGQTRSSYLTPQGSPIRPPSKTFSKAEDEARAKVEALSKGGGPLDLSLSQQMPNVPQVPIQRVVPPRGISPRMLDAMRDPKIADGVAKSIQAGMKDGIHFWYHTEPIRKAFQDVWGDRWEKPFKLFMDAQAAASPKSDVPTQIRNGTWLYHHGINGRELPPKGPDIYPYGHLGANLHRQNFATIMGPGWDVLKNPKPPSFSANLQGNLEPGTMDTHAMRNIGMRTGDPRWLATQVQEILKPGKQPSNWQAMFGEISTPKANGERIVIFRPQQLVRSGRITLQEALDRGPLWDSVPRPNEYAAMEDFYRHMARQFNLPTAGAQAAAWAGAGPLTGLGTVSDMTFVQLMNERIMYTSFMRGESPWKVLRDMILGHKPLLGLAGAGMLAPRLFSNSNEDQHQ